MFCFVVVSTDWAFLPRCFFGLVESLVVVVDGLVVVVLDEGVAVVASFSEAIPFLGFLPRGFLASFPLSSPSGHFFFLPFALPVVGGPGGGVGVLVVELHEVVEVDVFIGRPRGFEDFDCDCTFI